MKDNKKVWIVSAGLIVLGLYFFYKQKKQSAEPVIEEDPKADYDKVLKKGSGY